MIKRSISLVLAASLGWSGPASAQQRPEVKRPSKVSPQCSSSRAELAKARRTTTVILIPRPDFNGEVSMFETSRGTFLP